MGSQPQWGDKAKATDPFSAQRWAKSFASFCSIWSSFSCSRESSQLNSRCVQRGCGIPLQAEPHDDLGLERREPQEINTHLQEMRGRMKSSEFLFEDDETHSILLLGLARDTLTSGQGSTHLRALRGGRVPDCCWSLAFTACHSFSVSAAAFSLQQLGGLSMTALQHWFWEPLEGQRFP